MVTTVTGYTAAHLDELLAEDIIGGTVVGDNLILTKRDSSTINAGNVRGPAGSGGGTANLVICTSTTRPTGGSLFQGLHIYETDTGSRYVYSGSTWLYIGPNMPHKQLVKVYLATSGTTQSTTPVDLPSPLTISGFVKYRPDSSLFVSIFGTIGLDNPTSGAELYVDIGGTDTILTAILNSGTDGAYDSHTFTGEAEITGLAAGTIATIKAQWKVYTSAMTAVQTASWGLKVEEMMH